MNCNFCEKPLNETMATALNCEHLYCNDCFATEILTRCLKCNQWIKKSVTFFYREGDIKLFNWRDRAKVIY